MRRLSLALASLALMTSTGLAQEFSGNWDCKNADNQRAGILTIYGGSYGYASATFGSTASGVGTVTAYTDGVGFNDGNLRKNAGVEAGRLVPGTVTGLMLQLETSQKVLLTCMPL